MLIPSTSNGLYVPFKAHFLISILDAPFIINSFVSSSKLRISKQAILPAYPEWLHFAHPTASYVTALSKSYLIPHDFDYLVRGGRISSIVGKIGSVIKLVPVMTMSDDKKSLVKFTTKRTYKKAVQKIIEQMTEDGINSEHKLYIYHAFNEDGAEEVKKIILSSIPDADIEVGLLGPAFTTQGGPGCISIQYIKKHDALKYSLV